MADLNVRLKDGDIVLYPQTIKNNITDLEIVDNLTSTDTENPLSAAMGKALNDKCSPLYTMFYTYATPIYIGNSTTSSHTLTFSNLSQNESIHLLLFSRYGTFEIFASCGTSAFSGVTTTAISGSAPTVTKSDSGFALTLAHGQWTAIWGLYVHPHFPNSKVTIS